MQMEQGMHPIHEVFYIESLLSIAMTIQAEESVIASILEQIKNGTGENDKVLIAAAQNIVTQAALLSKYFAPIRKKKEHTKRAKILCETYNIDVTSSIWNKDVRDCLEHFDERLDKYLSGVPVGNFNPEYVGPRPNEDVTTFFRAYFTDEAVFKVLGVEVQLMPILDEVERLRVQLEEESKTGRFLMK